MKILLNNFLHKTQFKPKQLQNTNALSFGRIGGLENDNKPMPLSGLKKDTFEEQDLDYDIGSNILRAMLESGIEYRNGEFLTSNSKSKFAKIPCLQPDEQGNFRLSSLFAKNDEAKAFEQEFNRYMTERASFKRKDKIAINEKLKAILNAKYELCNDKAANKLKDPELTFKTCV